MKIRNRIAAIALVLLISLLPLSAAAEETPDSLTCIQKLLTYYEHYGDDAAADLEYWLAQLKQTDPELGDIWEKILARWSQINSGMDITTDTLPDGLPEDDSLCILVFGYKLNPDASISDELLGRLQLALKAARKYPNALVICSGGRTGSADRTISEAWRMYEYLVNRGVDRNRVIMENKALSATENVQNALTILYEEHPEVKSVAFIASDYLIPRAELLLYAQSLLAAAATGQEPVQIVSHSAFDVRANVQQTQSQTAASLAILAGMNLETYGNLEVPELSQLVSITVQGTTAYTAGDEPQMTVTAHYDSGITRNVTDLAAFSGIDLHKAGSQTLTAQYTEGDVTVSAKLNITVSPEPTEAPTETLPAPTEETAPPEPAAQDVKKPSASPVWIIAAVSAPLLFLVAWIQNKKG